MTEAFEPEQADTARESIHDYYKFVNCLFHKNLELTIYETNRHIHSIDLNLCDRTPTLHHKQRLKVKRCDQRADAQVILEIQAKLRDRGILK